jgi:hypothetical protein
MRAAESFSAILTRLEQAVAEVRSMALTVGLGRIDWHPGWLDLLRRTGDAIHDADVEAMKGLRAELDAFASAVDVGELPDGQWPIVGGLIINLRNILEALDPVAGAQPVRVNA